MEIFIIMALAAEVMAAILGLMIAIRNKKDFGWGIALTFSIYVFYDIVRFLALRVSEVLIGSLFFIASIAILWSVWRIYQESAK